MGPSRSRRSLSPGFWLWQVKSLDEAIEWVKRCPSPAGAQEGEIEIRPVFEMDDFSEQVKQQETRQRAQVMAKK